MDTNVSIEVLLILVLILANGFFAATEIAVVSVKRGRLEAQAENGSAAAKSALRLTDNPDRFLATVQVGITLIGTFSAAFGGARIAGVLADRLRTIPVLENNADEIALLLVVLAITYLSLVFGELVPKRLALRRAESVALVAAPIMNTLAAIARPVVVLLSVSVGFIVRLFGRDDDAGNLVTTEDIVYLVREGEESGSVESDEAQLIERIFHFADQPVRAIMTPRQDIFSVDIHLPLKEITVEFQKSGVTRMPVYEGEADNIVGVLNAKALLNTLASGEPFNLRALMLPPVFIVESAHIGEALARFRREGIHLGLVIDEYGQVSGLVTLEDMLEELVGEIRDEYDAETQEAFVQREDGSWLVDGLESYEKVVMRLGLPESDEDEPRHFTTLAGMIIDRLSHIPTVGEKVTEGGFTLEVIDMDGRRVDRVLITPPPKTEESDEDDVPDTNGDSDSAAKDDA